MKSCKIPKSFKPILTFWQAAGTSSLSLHRKKVDFWKEFLLRAFRQICLLFADCILSRAKKSKHTVMKLQGHQGAASLRLPLRFSSRTWMASVTFFFLWIACSESFVERGYLGASLAAHKRPPSYCKQANSHVGLAPAETASLRRSGLLLRSRRGVHRIGPLACAPTEDVKLEVNTLNERLWAAAEAGDGDLIRSLVSEGAEVNSQPYVPDAEESEKVSTAEGMQDGWDGSEPIRSRTVALEVNAEASDKEAVEKDEEAKLKEEKKKDKKKKKKDYENKVQED